MEANARSGKSEARRLPEDRRDHAQGCLLGQLAGDSLGSLVEFKTIDDIRDLYPDDVRLLADGGTWNTIAGQPTDDSEMALALARTILERGTYDEASVRDAYRQWLDSGPFDVGVTTMNGLRRQPDHRSQANGALMRISPLGIFGANHPESNVTEWARQDACITHPNLVCVEINMLFVRAISHAIAHPVMPEALYDRVSAWADDIQVKPEIRDVIQAARTAPPDDYITHQGWVMIAFQNALWQLLRAPSLEEGVVDTVMRGGDTDTNAAICGALLGAVHGRAAIPAQWEATILSCRPEAGRPNVLRPRPPICWPVDALELAEALLG